jgi:hypothetical protein
MNAKGISSIGPSKAEKTLKSCSDIDQILIRLKVVKSDQRFNVLSAQYQYGHL